VSEGCEHCYAERMARRQRAMGTRGYENVVNPDGTWTGHTAMRQHVLNAPLHWRKPRRIFVCSMGDLFHETVPDEWIDKVMAVAALRPQHTFLVLSKRPERMASYFSRGPSDMATGERGWLDAINDASMDIVSAPVFPSLKYGMIHGVPWPLPNIHLGVTAENQEQADTRIPILLQIPAAVRFVSVEPMLGPVDLKQWFSELLGTFVQVPQSEADLHCYPQEVHARADGIDHVICGGESGPGARPMHPDWVRSLRDQCVQSGTPFLFKQWGAWIHESQYTGGEFEDVDWERKKVGKKAAGRILDGRTWDQYPEVTV